jgi:hypothetical protein
MNISLTNEPAYNFKMFDVLRPTVETLLEKRYTTKSPRQDLP